MKTPDQRISDLEREVKELKEIVKGLGNQTSMLDTRTMPMVVIGSSSLLPGQSSGGEATP